MNRVVLVTGASGGIGAAIAAAFAQNGDRVALGYHTGLQRATQLQQQIVQQGGQAMPCPIDVTCPESVQAAFDAVRENWGAVDVLVNNAGIAQQAMLCDISLAEWDQMMAVHATGTFLCCRTALPDMVRQKSGCIVTISSMWGQVGASCEAHYSAAKAAQIGLTKALAKEVGPSGIRVNCVAPGMVETTMTETLTPQEKQDLYAETPLGRAATPQEVAALVLFLASPAAGFITGQVVGVNGGFII